MSSPLVQVTVVPAFTVSTGALKVKLPICTAAAAGAGVALVATATVEIISALAASAADWNVSILNPRVMKNPSGGERGIDQRDAVVAAHEHGVGNAEQAVELLGRDLERSWTGRGARRRLREGGRSRGMGGDPPFDLLGDLVDVAI